MKLKRLRIIKKIFFVFLLFQALATAFIAFHPATSKVENIAFLVIINLTFIALSAFTSFAILFTFGVSNSRIELNPRAKEISRATITVSAIATTGFALLVYDRIFVRGIDYTQGLRAARYLWIQSEGGSIFGILGNLMTPTSFLSLILTLLFYERLKPLTRLAGFSATAFGILGVSVLNGGRSIVLVAFIFAAVCVCFREKRKKKKGKAFKLIVTSCAIVAVSYSMYIFKSAANMSESSMKSLVSLGIDGLNGEFRNEEENQKEYSDFTYATIYASAYLFHGQWTAQVMHDLPVRRGSYALYPLSTFLERLGILEKPLEHGRINDNGAFISMPGAFFYDFGYIGVVVGSIGAGALFGLGLVVIARSKTIGCINFSYICYTSCVMIISPVVPAYGFIYLNLIIIAVPCFSLLNLVVSGNQLKLFRS